ncbi:MAG: hypothetical protein ACMG57_01715, partial [Candidatus Dojkabacteria bacterium]
MDHLSNYDLKVNNLIKVNYESLDIHSVVGYLNPIEDPKVRRMSNRSYLKLDIGFSREGIKIETIGDLCQFTYAEILRRLNGQELSANS